MEPLVSVVIPTFKRPKYLKRAIDSILNQTYKNVEIIVVDDNDPNTKDRNETMKVIDYYSNNNISYIKHEKNCGGSVARNTGWKASKGVYITFLDDDDEIVENKILKQVNCLEKLDKSWGACYTAYNIEKENGQSQYSIEKRSGHLYIDALMRTMFLGSGSNLFLRKSIVDKINGYDERFIRNQDIEFLVRVAKLSKIAYIDERLLIIHIEGNRIKQTWEKYEFYTNFYLKIFREEINGLSKCDKRRVISVISLERARVAISYKQFKEAIYILIENKVRFVDIFKYIKYIIHRIITGKSYGFYLK